jgi:prepilin-type N-terminal cleavage/methylation domain-containing protein
MHKSNNYFAFRSIINMPKTLQIGFTLIELLVVIAIIGILAAVVLVAINPAERIAEANDSKTKSNLGQVATAIESCYTANNGSYAAECRSAQVVAGPANDLTDGGYLKQAMPVSSTTGGGVTVGGTATAAFAYGEVVAKSNGGGCASSNHAYMEYQSSAGNTIKVVCQLAAPTS